MADGVVNTPLTAAAAASVSTTMGPLVGTQAVQTVANHAERPEKFSGLNFKRWQQKMLFYLTTLNLARFLTETVPQLAEGIADVQSLSAIDAQKKGQVDDFAKANVVEHGQSSRGNKGKQKKSKKDKAKVWDLGPKKGAIKKKFCTFKGNCYNCGEAGHRADQCKNPRQDKANMVDDNQPLVAMITDLTAMMEEVNIVSNISKGWWVDTGATRHVCPDRSQFHTLEESDGDEKLYMGNNATAKIKGEGDVILKWTSGKELTLSKVLYVPELRKSLVSGWLLNKFGFRLVFESDKFVLSKRGMFVGKGYAQNGMFKPNDGYLHTL